jgi:hypothetical protein
VSRGERSNALRLERQRLLGEIDRRRRELSKALAEIDLTKTEVDAALAPIAARQTDTEREIHALFAKLLAPGRLAKRKRAKVRQIYRTLQEIGLISPVEEGPFGDSSDWVGDERGYEAEDGDTGPFEGADSFGAPHGGFDFGAAQVRSANRLPDDEKHRTLRTLFKRLVVTLHPDRARHADEVARRTAAMKEVTQAYESGDLAQLINLDERFTGGGMLGNVATTPSQIDTLERIVADLKAQLRRQLDELRMVRRSDAFRAAKDLQRLRNAGEDPIGMLAEEEQGRLDDLVATRDFVAAFEESKMSFSDFVRGPSLRADGDDGVGPELDDMFDEMLAQLIDAEAAATAPRRRRRSGRKPPPDPIPF